ncbi:hypothetical protein TrVGV298_006219 [Trichoderma virens]|nr:hypothetical protein TrVGV298_006219 [Trichoderma virens]
MAGLFTFLHRNYKASNPPIVPKSSDPIRFGILGAANIGPDALFIPARSHPEVVIQAVAARDKAKAKAYADKHGIPVVLDSYDGMFFPRAAEFPLINDASIDVVYIALPNGLHFQWALAALEKGKHVLLEKPSVSNATEAELLFHSPLLSKPGAPVLLDAVHYNFHPTWQYFMSQINQTDVVYASHTVLVPTGIIKPTDIRYNYDLAGGAIMDLGSYGISALRAIFAAEPESCVECTVKPTVPPASELCDAEYTAKLQFPGGAIGEIRGTYDVPWLKFRLPNLEVLHRPTEVPDDSIEPNQVKIRTRKVVFYGHMFATIYNRIDTEDTFEVRNRDDQQPIKKWTEKISKSAHSFREIGMEQPGETYWKSYRYQLEEFVQRIKGRSGNGIWVSADESIAQMKAIDMVYAKSGFGVRPSHERQVS